MTSTPATAPVVRPNRHLVGLDGLRGLAAVAVLIDHVGQHSIETGTGGVIAKVASLGAQGLTIFFALSGFLLFSPYVASIFHGKALPSTRRYFVNRALRIYPAYIVIFVLVAFVFGVAYVHGTPELHPTDGVGRMSDPVAIVVNLLLLQSYIPSTVATGIGPAWSLTTELTFYALLPLLAAGGAALARRTKRHVAALAPALLMIAIGLATSTFLAVQTHGMGDRERLEYSWGSTWTAVLDRSLLSQAALFGFGMLAAWVVERRAQDGRFVLGVLDRTGLLVIALCLAAFGSVIGDYVGVHIVGVAAAIGIYVAVTPTTSGAPGYFGRALEVPPIRGLGLISYSMYLWHVPVISFLVAVGVMRSGPIGVLINIVITLLITIALATCTFFGVERPAMRLRRRLEPRRRVVASPVPD